MEWHQRNKVQTALIVSCEALSLLDIFGYKTEVVMRITIAELLAFAYNLEYLLRLTKLKYTHIFIVDFHGSRIYQKSCFSSDVLLLPARASEQGNVIGLVSIYI